LYKELIEEAIKKVW